MGDAIEFSIELWHRDSFAVKNVLSNRMIATGVNVLCSSPFSYRGDGIGKNVSGHCLTC